MSTSIIRLFGIIIFVTFAGLVSAEEGTFCDGYQEGYTSVPGFEDSAPICPPVPVIPVGQRPILEGIKMGIEDAQNG